MTADDQSRLVPRASAMEALTQIRALCDEREHGPGPGWIPVDEVRAVLDAVSVDATPAQGIDRDALLRVIAGSRLDDDDDETADRFLALVRPVEGVTLTPEEIEWLRPVLRSMLAPHPAFVIEGLADKVSALASRLEASA